MHWEWKTYICKADVKRYMIYKTDKGVVMNININSNVVVTLIDAICRGCGALYEPTHFKRLTDAKAYEITALAKAEVQKRRILANSLDAAVHDEQLERIVERIVGQEMKRQANIDAIAKIALDELMNKELEAKEKVDTDWLTRFFSIAQEFSDDELRHVWGKILSQEILTPNSYSLRTLSVVSKLSKKEAELFASIGEYVLFGGQTSFLIEVNGRILGGEIGYDEISLLMECGLIRESHGLCIESNPENDEILAAYKDCAFLMRRKERKGMLRIPIYELSTAGKELYSILPLTSNTDYLQKIADYYRDSNIICERAKLGSTRGKVIEYEEEGKVLL